MAIKQYWTVYFFIILKIIKKYEIILFINTSLYSGIITQLIVNFTCISRDSDILVANHI